MRRVYVGASYLFIVGGAVLFVGGIVETLLSEDRSLTAFVVAGFTGCLSVGMGLAFWGLAAAREGSTRTDRRADAPRAQAAGAHDVKAAVQDGRQAEALELASAVIARASTDPERETVVRYVRRLGTPDAAEWLRDRLDDENPGVVALAAQSAGLLGDRQAVPHLQELLGSEDFIVRLNAAFALGLLPQRSSVAPLTGALDDRAWRVRGSAVKALAQIRAPEAAQALQAARSRSWRTRRASRRAARRLRRELAGA